MAFHQPYSLLKCSSRTIGVCIVEAAVDVIDKFIEYEDISAEERRDAESLITRTAEFFDTLIPTHLHDIVTQSSLECLPYDLAYKLQCVRTKLNFLDIILRSHTTRFNITEWPDEIHNALYRSIHRLKNLQYVTLEPETLENTHHVSVAIKNMKKLNSFECKNCCDKILKVLCENCPLRKLDICDSLCVTDSSLPYILNFKDLEELNILFCRLLKESCLKILSNLPNLKTISCDYLPSFLKQINDDNLQLPYQSVKLCCYAAEDVVTVVKYCPMITKLDLLIDEFQGGSYDFSCLASLNHLRSLKVCSYPLDLTKIKSFLELKGHQLIELELSYLTYTSTKTANEIKSLCTNLKSFSLISF